MEPTLESTMKRLEACRKEVNRECSIGYLRLFNEEEDLYQAFNGRSLTVGSSFDLLSPEQHKLTGNFLVAMLMDARDAMATKYRSSDKMDDAARLMYKVIDLHVREKPDPVDRTEAIEAYLAEKIIQSATERDMRFLERSEEYGKLRSLVPETNIQALLSHSETALQNHRYTAGHQIGTTYEHMGFLDWGDENVEDFPITRKSFIDARDGTLHHDTGKSALSEGILNAARKLTHEEWDKMRAHPLISAKIIEHVPAFEEETKIVQQHHERWDGKGYPHGLKGEKIHPLARTLAIADSFDAMTSKRRYKDHHQSPRDAADEILKGAGTQFDPYYAGLFVTYLAANNYSRENILADNSTKWIDLRKYGMDVPVIQ
ncbi:HD-GYP domain-containing protein [Thermoproteota archaeon]